MKMREIFLTLFLIITTALYFFSFQSQIKSDHLILFFKDSTIAERVAIQTNEDHGTAHITETRIFHNKFMMSLNNVFINLAEDTDPIFLYSLSPDSFFVNQGQRTFPLLPAIEFPFFVIATIFIIRNWNKSYYAILWMLGVSLVVCALFMPIMAPLKLLPLVITLQTITFFGLWDYISIALHQRVLSRSKRMRQGDSSPGKARS